MKATGGVAFLCVLILLFSLLAPPTLHAIGPGPGIEEAQIEVKREVLVAYQLAISRVLRVVNVTGDLAQRIENILAVNASQVTDEEELSGLIAEARDLLDELAEVVEPTVTVRMNVTIEAAKLRAAVEVLRELAVEVNATEAVTRLGEILDMLEAGRVEEAKRTLVNLTMGIEEARMRRASDAVERAALVMLEHGAIGVNETAVSALKHVIRNVNRTVAILEAVKSKLKAVNASEIAITALDRAIENLKETTNILVNVAEVVNVTRVHAKAQVVNVTRRVMFREALDRISDMREKLGELAAKIKSMIAMAVEMNESEVIDLLTETNTTITDALGLLDFAEEAVAEGDAGKVMRLIALVKVKIKKIDRAVEFSEELLEEISEEKGVLRRELQKKIEKLDKRVKNKLRKIEEIKASAIEVNSTEALALLANASSLLRQIEEMINRISAAVEQGNYTEARYLLKLVDKIFDEVDEIMERCNDAVENTREAAEMTHEFMRKVEKIQKRIFELEREAHKLETLGVTEAEEAISMARDLINKAHDALDRAKELIKQRNLGDAEVAIKTAEELLDEIEDYLEQAKEIVSEKKQEIEAVREELKEEIEKLREKIGELRDKIDELREEYKDDRASMMKLENAERHLDQAERHLEKAEANLDNVEMAKSLIDEAKRSIKMAEEIIRELER